MASNNIPADSNQKNTDFIRLTILVITAIAFFMIGLSAKAGPNYIPKSIDINKADTTVFIALPGIGSKLAARIVQYRSRLRGFRSVEQLAEVYGLADSTFQKIKPWLVVTEAGIGKIDLNTATIEELRMPYISYNLANIIVQYRSQHGLYKKVEDLKKIMLIDEATFAKIAPYFTTDSESVALLSK